MKDKKKSKDRVTDDCGFGDQVEYDRTHDEGNRLVRFLNLIDIYGREMNFTTDGNCSTIKTTCGGITTIFFVLGILYYISI